MHLCSVKRFILFFAALLAALPHGVAQGIPVGTWRAHFPLRATHSVALLAEEVLVASPYGLLLFDPVDKVTTAATVVEGLSDVDLTCAEASPLGKKALLGYSDGGMDIWSHQDVRRIGDIPQSGAYPGQSDIRAVVFADEQRAFAATGFGIVELNLTYGVVQGTYLLRADGGTTPAYDLSIEGDSLFAATASGLWAVSLNDPLYLPTSWVPHSRWKDQSIARLAVQQGRFLVQPEGSLDVWYGYSGNWIPLPLDTTDQPAVRRLRRSLNGFLVVRSFGVTEVALDASLGATVSSGFGNNTAFHPYDAAVDAKGTLYVANRGRGLTFVDNPDYAQHRAVQDPQSAQAYALEGGPEGVHVLTGAVDATWTATYTNEGVLHFDGLR